MFCKMFMKSVILSVLVVTWVAQADGRDLQDAPPGLPFDDPGWQANHPHHPNHIIVSFDNTSGAPGRPVYGSENVRVVNVQAGETPGQAVARYQRDPNVKYAEVDYLLTPNKRPVGRQDPPCTGEDPLRDDYQWGWKDVGTQVAWNSMDELGNQNTDFDWVSNVVKVCVIDTGVYNHPDLAGRVSTRVSSLYGNGVPSGDEEDTEGHGTHCAGVIGAVPNNCIGIAGINKNVDILSCKFMGPNGGYTSDAVSCIYWCAGEGATISSNSWGGGGDSQALYEAIRDAGDGGHLFVTAAGNDGNNFDVGTLSFPAGYGSERYVPKWIRKNEIGSYPPLGNILSVAALDENLERPRWSNYGYTGIHIGAPGVRILSTVLGDKYASWSGTSMACPHVAGAAVLLKTAEPNATVDGIKKAIMDSAEPTAGLEVMSGGRLNINNALSTLLNQSNTSPVGPPGQDGGKPGKGGGKPVRNGNKVNVRPPSTPNTRLDGVTPSPNKP